MRHLIVIGAIFAAVPFLGPVEATAQTVNCQPTIIGMPQAGVTCQSSGVAPALRPAGPGTIYSWKDVTPRPCTRLEIIALGQTPNNMCEARLVASNRKKVGDLIGEGKCDEALKAALGTGDLAFAREVREFCAASAKAETAPASAQ